MVNRTDPSTKEINKEAIDMIVGKRIKPCSSELQYMVKWIFKPQTWEPFSHLNACEDLIKTFELNVELQNKLQEKRAEKSAVRAEASTAASVKAFIPNVNLPSPHVVRRRPDIEAELKP